MAFVAAVVGLMAMNAAQAQKVTQQDVDRLSQFSIDRVKKLREVERYQFKVAESYYRKRGATKNDYKTALGEYEKYLRLYERSEAAPYAQLAWSNCQVRLRQLNTAIRDGYQSVIDYWPDSPEAITARFLIGRTYKDMGEVRKARQTFKSLVADHPKSLQSVYAAVELIDIAGVEKDEPSQLALWKKLVFETPRDKGRGANNSSRNRICRSAAQNFASHSFASLAFDDGVKALSASFAETDVPYQLMQYTQTTIWNYTGDAKNKIKGEKLADLAIAFMKRQIPDDRSTPELKARAKQLWYYVADLHSSARRDPQVIVTYKQIEKIFGVEDEQLGRLANWYKGRNRYDDARATYARFKDQINGRYQIAYSFAQQGKWDQAAAAYRNVLAADPDNPVKWKPYIADALRRGGKHAEAVAVYRELVQQDANKPGQWRWQIAYTLQHYARDYEQAVAMYRQCDDYTPQNYFSMAECRIAQKQYSKAKSLYDLVIGSEPNHAAQAWWYKAMVYSEKRWNKKELEIRSLREICKRYPKSGLASQAHNRLQSVHKITVTLGGGKDE